MTTFRYIQVFCVLSMILLTGGAAYSGRKMPPADITGKSRPHNVILFVADGLRAKAVTMQTMPTLAALRDGSVNFVNSHSLYPTITMANASGLSTGHFIGDTGTINTLYVGFPVAGAGNSVIPFLESDTILGEMDQHYSGNYMNEETLLAAARRNGFSTAAIGKLGPTFLFDHTARDGRQTIVFDDSTGTPAGIPLNAEIQAKLTSVGLPLAAPARGENGRSGDFQTPGTTVANIVQQTYFADAASKAVLPLFKERSKPFMMVFWSRDPDGSQHNQGDSLNKLTPGINGPTSRAALKNADNDLAQLQQALKDLGLDKTTDIIVVADHGFSTISKQSSTSSAAQDTYRDVVKGQLPPGFVAIDLKNALRLPLFDPDANNTPVAAGAHPRQGSGLLGNDPNKPDVVVAANGGSDMIYLPGRDKNMAAKIVGILAAADYTSGIFVNDELGPIPGTLPMSAVNLEGSGLTPRPDIVVSFRSFIAPGCAEQEKILCTVEISDSSLRQGQGNHGSFSRSDTMNFMAATGPDFKEKFIDQAPVSNADIGRTIAALLGLDITPKGKLMGRIITEAQLHGKPVKFTRTYQESTPGVNGLKTVLLGQIAGGERYFDAAGFLDITVGLPVTMALK